MEWSGVTNDRLATSKAGTSAKDHPGAWEKLGESLVRDTS
jgi:hypothetical protein